MAIRILHTGDLHIGNFPGPEENGENVRFKDICKCLDALVAGAKEQKPDIAVIAGDIFHQARVWSDRGLKEQQTAVRFLRELERICPVVVMRGTPNHDSEEQFKTLDSTFYGDDSVHIITEPDVGTYHSYDGKAVQIACLPGFDRGFYRAKHPGLSKEEENEVFTQSIADLIVGLKAQCDAGSPTVLVSHYTITGCNMESGQTAFFSQFEPVVYPDTLQAADFDLVCFGHIHRPQQLDGCKNTFYCGAISALNFNDEGQERGYWLHDVEDDGTVRSTFQQLPTRRYKTIRLKDEDVAEIINADRAEDKFPFPVPDVKGDIVRVLYDCTDEHNKAFNHTVYEAALYNVGGAFWVQEITPQKISITVDKKSMDADGTPESNLAEYLAEKEFTPERLGEIIELARPIIAEATEKATTERHTGLFVPVEIEVKNYRNYREETFSFEDIRFCTINGSNGVGKSSLFMDAMADALFEETREGELTGWICNDPDARSGAIKFTFKLGESLYRVTRTRQKSGKATLNISEFVEGEWVDHSKEKFKDTQQEIINIIGMDSLTLKACALIMQDQYGLFLQADKEARMNILGNILGLGIYAGMEELAADKATETNRQIRQLQDKTGVILSGLPDRAELEVQIAAEEEIKETYEQAAAVKTTEIDGLKVKLNTQLEAASRVIKLNGKITTLGTQKATKEAAKTSQVGIVTAADTILAKEEEITAGVAAYNGLLEKEKELIKGKATYDNLEQRKKQLESTIDLAEKSAKELAQKKAAITLVKIGPLEAAISRAAELEEKHQQYGSTAGKIAELEKGLPEYTEQRQAVLDAEAEFEKLEADYEKAKEKLSYRITTLKGKVELLDNSGCPDVEKASCKFLADALEAKKALPEAEAELTSLETEYTANRQSLSDTLRQAETVFSDKMHLPEEIEALRGNLRVLEAAEKEYSSLETQRNELKLMQERSEELAKAQASAEETAAKGKTELEKVTAELEAVEVANSEYAKLQQDILAARTWLDKEKQLPVARQQKEAASLRVLELSGEIEELEKELEETRTELEEEQSKTVGTAELQAQVAAAETEIKAMQDAAQAATLKLGGLKKQAEELTEKLQQAAELQNRVNVLGGKAAGYEELKKAFSQDGIPHNIIRSIIPVFEATATNILGQMSQGRMSVEFVTEKVLKSNSKKEVTTLDIIINDVDTGRLPYMSRSGGERVKAALSVILALSEIKSSKAGVQLGFLFIDEPPFLDAPGVQAYCDALEAIQNRYSNLKVMAITHDPAMKSRFPQSVDVVKTAEGSKVIYE